MSELKPYQEQFLTELIQHPGWKVFIDIIKQNSDSLLESLYLCTDTELQNQTLSRWRALETLHRQCKELENARDVVQLGR